MRSLVHLLLVALHRIGVLRPILRLSRPLAARAIGIALADCRGVHAVYRRRGWRRGERRLDPTLRFAIFVKDEVARKRVFDLHAGLRSWFGDLEAQPLVFEASSWSNGGGPGTSAEAHATPDDSLSIADRLGWKRVHARRSAAWLRRFSGPDRQERNKVLVAEILHWHGEVTDLTTTIYRETDRPSRALLRRRCRLLASASCDLSNLFRALLWNENVRAGVAEVIEAGLQTPRNSRVHTLFRQSAALMSGGISADEAEPYVHAALCFIDNLFATYCEEIRTAARLQPSSPVFAVHGSTTASPARLPDTPDLTISPKYLFRELQSILLMPSASRRNGNEAVVAYLLAEPPAPHSNALALLHQELSRNLEHHAVDGIAEDFLVLSAAAYRAFGHPPSHGKTPRVLHGPVGACAPSIYEALTGIGGDRRAALASSLGLAAAPATDSAARHAVPT